MITKRIWEICQKQKFLFFRVSALILVALIGGAMLVGQQIGKDGESQEIPLKEIYANFDQKDLKLVGKFLTEVGNKNFNKMSMKAGGASNIFLVRGDTIGQAFGATYGIFASVLSADKPGHIDSTELSQKFWLVAYFGAGSSGPKRWIIQSALKKNKKLELHFRTAPPGGVQTQNIVPYFAWVPLGSLQDGAYTLKLIDDGTGETMLARCVFVENKQP